MTVEYRVTKNQWASDNRPHVQFHNTEVLKPRADFVKELVSRWGMVQAVDSGEDAAGRRKFDLMSPVDVVNRAMEMSELMYQAFADNDLYITLPTMKEMDDIVANMTADKESEIMKKLNADIAETVVDE